MALRDNVSNFWKGLQSTRIKVPRIENPFRAPEERKTYSGERTSGSVIPISDNSPAWSEVKKYGVLASEGYLNNVYAYSCIRQIAMSTASVPWLVKKKTDGKVDEIIDDHPLYDTIDRPNPEQGWGAFMENIITDLFISGNAYIIRAGPSNKPPRELYCLRPDRMKVVSGTQAQRVWGYEYIVNNTKLFYPAELVCHIKFHHPLDDWYGLPPLSPAMRSIRANNAGRSWHVSQLEHSAMPSGAFKTPTELDEEGFARMRRMIAEQYSGSVNAGRPLLLEGGMDWVSLSMSPAQMNWGDALRLSSKEIAVALGVPPELIGDNSNKTYSNFGEARKAFYVETILPLLDYVEGEFNHWLTPLYPDEPYIEYNKDEIEALQPDLAQMWQRLIQALAAGVLSVNEVRLALGYEEVDGGDDLMALLQQQMMGGGMNGGAGGAEAAGGAAPALGFGGAPAPAGGAGAAPAAPGAGPAPTGQAPAGFPSDWSGGAAQPAAGAAPAANEPLTVASIVKSLLGEQAGAPKDDEKNAIGMPPGGIKGIRTKMYLYGHVSFKPSQRKERNTDHYTYPLDDMTLGTYNSDKTEVGAYFKGVFVSNMIRRAMGAFNQDFNAMDDLSREILAVVMCEAAARTFPTRELYDQYAAPYSRAMQKGGADPDGKTWEADPWKSMTYEDLYAGMKENVTQLNTMLQGGQYTIMSQELYPYAAKALMYSRMLYHKLLKQQVEASIAAGKPIIQMDAAPAAATAPAEAAKSFNPEEIKKMADKLTALLDQLETMEEAEDES